MAWIDPHLAAYGSKTHSQNNEDGIISYLISEVPLTSNFFVEFGVGPPASSTIDRSGLECNCRLLLENGWRGLMMDGGTYPPQYNVQREIITALNINVLLAKYRVPTDFDLISIDIDGQDFWVWLGLMAAPKIVVIEYNGNIPSHESRVIPFDVDYRWDCTKWSGASLLALTRLGLGKGYILVYANGVNAFFVRQDLLDNATDFKYENIYVGGNWHDPDPYDRPWVTI